MNQGRLFFDHIPKTAGTSLQRFFVEAFGEQAVTRPLKGQKLSHVLSIYRDYRVLTGHFHFIPGGKLPEGYVSATVLRDPRERTLSEYFFIVNDVPEANCNPGERLIKAMPLEEALYEPSFSQRLQNYQSAHFASFFHQTPLQLDQLELLQMAKKGLEQYHLVGVTERLNEFVDVLKRVFDIPKEVMLKRYNVTSKRMKFDRLSPELQRRIMELVEVDMELWRYTQVLFDSRTKDLDLSTFLRGKTLTDSPEKFFHAPMPELSSVQEDGSLELLNVTICGKVRPEQPVFIPGELAVLRVSFRALKDKDDLTIGYSIYHDSGLHIFGMNSRLLGKKHSVKAGGEYYIDFVFSMNLGHGRYFVNISAHSGQTHLERCYLWREKVSCFDVDGFADVPFEGLVRLMPSVYAGILGSEGRLECEHMMGGGGGHKIGMNTPPITDCRGFIRSVSKLGMMTLRPGEQVAISVEVMNQGQEIWILEGNKPVYLSYHWLAMTGKALIFDGFRSPIPCNEIQPNHLIQATVMVEAPKETGDFILELTLVQEAVTWFEQKGLDTERVAVKVDMGNNNMISESKYD